VVHYNQTIAKHLLKSKIRGYSIKLGVAPNSSCFCPLWVRLRIGYDLTWVRVRIGYELSWGRVGKVRVVLGTTWYWVQVDLSTSWQSTSCLGYELTGTPYCVHKLGYDFRLWGQRFFPFFQHGSIPKPYHSINLPFYRGADEAISRNSNTNTFTRQYKIPQLWHIQPIQICDTASVT